VENHVCLSCVVHVASATCQAATRIMAGVGDLVQRTGDGPIGQVLGSRTIGRSGDVVCGLHLTRRDEERGFLGSASKLRSTVCPWFCLKTTETVSPGLASKPVARLSQFVPQNRQLWFGNLCLKITVMVSWFGPQNQAKLQFIGCATKSMGGRRCGTRVEI
jgi:hypothetical protein